MNQVTSEERVPRLAVANQAPMAPVETDLLNQQAGIEAWLQDQWRATPAPFYASVDLRNAGYKIAPVDTNLFPAGFNNLNRDMYDWCTKAIQSVMQRICPHAKSLLIIPENHTRNQFYLENLAALHHIIQQAGYDVRIGSLVIKEPTTFELPSGRTLLLEPVQRIGHRIQLDQFNPCSVLLNNDLSSGRPAILENLEQTLLPPLALGWNKRLKSNHFAQYRDLVQEFSREVGIDPWLMDPLMRNCGAVNFIKREGMECLEHHVENLLAQIQQKYNEYGIQHKPMVFVKADAGTYGMGVMSISDVSQLQSLNRKQRTKMDATKEGQKVSSVIIQEGVYTTETVDHSTAEPVIYMIDQYVVGGFYRLHNSKSNSESLNSPGMRFQPMPFAQAPEKLLAGQVTFKPDTHSQDPDRFYAYGVIARLAMLAAAREIALAKQEEAA